MTAVDSSSDDLIKAMRALEEVRALANKALAALPPLEKPKATIDWSRFLRAWHEEFGSERVPVSKLVESKRLSRLAQFVGRPVDDMGNLLKARIGDEQTGDYLVERVPDEDGRKGWRVVKVDAEPVEITLPIECDESMTCACSKCVDDRGRLMTAVKKLPRDNSPRLEVEVDSEALRTFGR